MPPGSKTISIETKIIYALTGNHHVRKQHEDSILIPNMYKEFLEDFEVKGNSELIPKPIIEGRILSFNNKRTILDRNLKRVGTSNLCQIIIKLVIFKGIIAYECLATIDNRIKTNLIHVGQINKEECKELIEPHFYSDFKVEKCISLRIKIEDLEYYMNMEVVEYSLSTPLTLGTEFLKKINYKITNEGIKIFDQENIRFINKI